MLADHEFAEMTRHIGELGLAAIAANQGARRRGLLAQRRVRIAIERGDLRILGAGLASSFGEPFQLESAAVERLSFSNPRALTTGYRHDAFQPRYLVSSSLDETVAAILDLSPDGMLKS